MVFGVQPGLLLDLVQGTVVDVHSPAPARGLDAIPAVLVRRHRRSPDRLVVVPRTARRSPRARRATPSSPTGGPRMTQDLVTIAPLIVAVLTAAAILIVDLVVRADAIPRSGRLSDSAITAFV